MVLIDVKIWVVKFIDKVYKFIDGVGMFMLVYFNSFCYWCFCYCILGKEKIFVFGVYLEVFFFEVCVKWDEV